MSNRFFLSLLLITVPLVLIGSTPDKHIKSSAIEPITVELSMAPADFCQETINGVVVGLLATETYVVAAMINSPNSFFATNFHNTEKGYYFGPKGRGPQDFIKIDPKSLRLLGDDSFEVFDAGKMKKVILNTSGAVVESSPVSGKWLNLPLNGIQRFGDGFVDITMIATPDSEETEFTVFDDNGNITGYLGKYPTWASDESVSEALAYIKVFATSPDGQHLAAFYGHFYKARFFKNGKKRYETVELPYKSNAPLDHVRKCFTGRPYVSDDGIVVLCHNGDKVELQKWTWDGKLVKVYALSQPVSFFCFTPDGKSLIGYDAKADKFYIASIPN